MIARKGYFIACALFRLCRAACLTQINTGYCTAMCMCLFCVVYAFPLFYSTVPRITSEFFARVTVHSLGFIQCGWRSMSDTGIFISRLKFRGYHPMVCLVTLDLLTRCVRYATLLRDSVFDTRSSALIFGLDHELSTLSRSSTRRYM